MPIFQWRQFIQCPFFSEDNCPVLPFLWRQFYQCLRRQLSSALFQGRQLYLYRQFYHCLWWGCASSIAAQPNNLKNLSNAYLAKQIATERGKEGKSNAYSFFSCLISRQRTVVRKYRRTTSKRRNYFTYLCWNDAMGWNIL